MTKQKKLRGQERRKAKNVCERKRKENCRNKKYGQNYNADRKILSKKKKRKCKNKENPNEERKNVKKSR